MEIPEKCKECIHRTNDFCKGYGAKIELLTIENCTRRKTTKRKKKCSKWNKKNWRGRRR